ncbi:UPF0695 membrane isoform X2 [Micractinium conductrix]|uniref:UPF0695 membrane isoform X2 n=1 Tax=Micractinium conductrix TaxID=554055 RepID=A0A2P6VHB4_9CHLO|nr:UPF0695 membrane isoform X2 [Micractinium conductrix]|eukprot:PSC73475.1 UPF0695 membrane isoform X2 [Micractinium conductrix]
MLGCFIIGLCAASSVLGLATDKALAALPAGHAWQHNLELQIGVRTGYCGSLTTFASWQLELVVLAVQGHKWVEAAMGYLAGIFASIACYMLGMHAALAIDRWLLGERHIMEQLQLYRESQIAQIEGLAPDGGETPAQKLLLQAEPDLPRLMSSQRPTGSVRRELLQRHSRHAAAAGMAAGVQSVELAGGQAANGTHAAAGTAAAAAAVVEPGNMKAQSEDQQQQQQQHPDGKAPEAALTPRSLAASLAGYRTDAAALALLLALTAALAVGTALQRDHSWLRTVWVSCLLGPAGCILRWWLSKWNYTLAGEWAWLPAGTLAANMLGTAVDFGLQAVLQRRGAARLGAGGSLLLAAAQTGFCGSLTTVSTFVTEIVKLAEAIPENFRAYSYAIVSMGGGILLGLTLFAWTIWAP